MAKEPDWSQPVGRNRSGQAKTALPTENNGREAMDLPSEQGDIDPIVTDIGDRVGHGHQGGLKQALPGIQMDRYRSPAKLTTSFRYPSALS